MCNIKINYNYVTRIAKTLHLMHTMAKKFLSSMVSSINKLTNT